MIFKHETEAKALRILERFHYEDGCLYRDGKNVSGWPSNNGYLSLMIDGATHPYHRVVWLVCKGVWAQGDVDHRDDNKRNNTIENLRECTRSQNVANRPQTQGRSKYRGVGYCARDKKPWRAWCGSKNSPRFTTEEAAARWYDMQALKQYGEFAKLNFDDSIIVALMEA